MMNVLSLFDGMSCGMIALERAGIKVTNYYASEIDKYAQIISQKNYPNIIRLGDVVKWKEWDLPKIDLLIGGSPCQGFSMAGKRLNFDDPRSKLFFEFVDILKTLKPTYFLLENVMMKKEWQDVISEHLGVEPIMINSALLSAQNRKRLYWTNIPDVDYPCGKDIILADIIEDNIDGFEYKGAAKRNQITKRGLEAQLNIRKDYKSNAVVSSYPEKLNGLVMVGMADDIKGHESIRRIYSVNGKSPTLTNMQGGHRQPKISINRDKSKTLGSSSRSINGKMATLWWRDNTYRKLTPKECERLQTVPDNYTEGVSNTQRYKMLGNGWTVDVIAHIFSYLP